MQQQQMDKELTNQVVRDSLDVYMAEMAHRKQQLVRLLLQQLRSVSIKSPAYLENRHAGERPGACIQIYACVDDVHIVDAMDDVLTAHMQFMRHLGAIELDVNSDKCSLLYFHQSTHAPARPTCLVPPLASMRLRSLHAWIASWAGRLVCLARSFGASSLAASLYRQRCCCWCTQSAGWTTCSAASTGGTGAGGPRLSRHAAQGGSLRAGPGSRRGQQ